MKKQELKQELRKLGLKIYKKKNQKEGAKAQASFVRKGDIWKILAENAAIVIDLKDVDTQGNDYVTEYFGTYKIDGKSSDAWGESGEHNFYSDIDSELDFEFVEFLLKSGFYKFRR